MAKKQGGQSSNPVQTSPSSVASEKGVRGTFGATPTKPVDVKKGGSK